MWRLLRDGAAARGGARALVLELPAAPSPGAWPDASGAAERLIFGRDFWGEYSVASQAAVGVAWLAADGSAVRRALRRPMVPFEVGREHTDDMRSEAEAPELHAWLKGLGEDAPCAPAAECAFCKEGGGVVKK